MDEKPVHRYHPKPITEADRAINCVASRALSLESSGRSDLAQPKHFQLQTLLSGATPEILEEAVTTGVEVLDQIKIPMLEKAPYAPDAAQWMQQIGK